MHSKSWLKRIVIAIGVASLLVVLWLTFRPSTATSPVVENPQKSSSQPSKPVEPSFDKTAYSTTDASSVWVIVNKQHPLQPIEYAPASLKSVGNGQRMRTDAADAFLAMQEAARQAGSPIVATSAYRSYTYQQSVYGGYVKQYGVTQTDTFSARPGYSEHQTGLAVDIQGGGCVLDNCFANTAQGTWLAANAYKYGFLLRYTPDKQSVTGYQHEAWHFRYVGPGLASEMHTQGVETLEEFFGVSGGSDY